jgi:hypothetical protein
MVNTTGFPEPPPVAAGTYVPPYTGLAGAEEKMICCDSVKVIVTDAGADVLISLVRPVAPMLEPPPPLPP